MKKKEHQLAAIRKEIAKWQQSGLTQADFCNQSGHVRRTFSNWVRKYSSATLSEQFIPLELAKQQNPLRVSGSMEIHYPNGVTIICATGMSVGELKALVQLVN